MTFKEAVDFKNTKESPYEKDGVTMKVYITPSKKEDFLAFVDFYNTNNPIDKSAIKFCSNGDFSVYGLGPRTGYLFYHKLS